MWLGDTSRVTLTPTPGPEDSQGLVEVLKVLAAGLGGGAGFLASGPFGAAVAAGAAQGAGAVLDLVADRWRSRQTSQATGAVEVAVRKSGLSPAQLAEMLVSDPRALLVATTAFNAAAETALCEKVHLMGCVVANAATDTALVDEELLVARAMRLLEAPHVRILALLNEPPGYDADTKGSSTMRWSPAQLAHRVDWPRRSVTSVLLTLQSIAAALLSTPTVDGGRASFRELLRERKPLELDEMVCEITDFGAYLIQRLDQSQSDIRELGLPSA